MPIGEKGRNYPLLSTAVPPAPLSWFSDGWHGYRRILVRVYRKPTRKGKRGRPAWVVPETLTLTQTVTHRHEHGRRLSVETRAALGPGVGQAGTVHVERLKGALRDRLNALTRKTHAFAKRNALVGLHLFDHNFHRAHQARLAAWWEGRASLSPPVSGDGFGADRSSLVVPRLVDDSDSYHPFMRVLAHSRFVPGLLCFTLIVSVVFEFANPILLGLLPKNSTLPEDE